MTCCGKNIVQKAEAIAVGNFAMAMDKMKLLPKERIAASRSRLMVCRQCEQCTWLTWSEYWAWVDGNGGKKKFFTEIEDLTNWPLLPKQEYEKGRKLFCRICKCWLPAKSYVINEKCPLVKWQENTLASSLALIT